MGRAGTEPEQTSKESDEPDIEESVAPGVELYSEQSRQRAWWQARAGHRAGSGGQSGVQSSEPERGVEQSRGVDGEGSSEERRNPMLRLNKSTVTVWHMCWTEHASACRSEKKKMTALGFEPRTSRV